MSCSLAVLSICFTAERGMLPTSDADVAVQFCAAAQSLLFYWKRKHKRTYELVWICCSRYHCSVQPGSTDRSVATGHSAWLVAGAASRIGALSLLAVLGCVGCVHHDDGLHAVAVHPTAHTADHAAPGAPGSPLAAPVALAPPRRQRSGTGLVLAAPVCSRPRSPLRAVPRCPAGVLLVPGALQSQRGGRLERLPAAHPGGVWRGAAAAPAGRASEPVPAHGLVRSARARASCLRLLSVMECLLSAAVRE